MTPALALSYIVKNTNTGETTSFPCGDWLAAREKAVALAVEHKAAAEGDDSYRGIRLVLEYSPGTKEAAVSLHEILTGKKMPSEDILTTLHGEAEILTRCGKDFDEMCGQMEDRTYRAVNHRYATLYYFTVPPSADSSLDAE